MGDDFHDYKLGKAVCLKENKILFVGGITGTFIIGKDDDMVKTCSILTITSLKIARYHCTHHIAIIMYMLSVIILYMELTYNSYSCTIHG